MNEDDKEMGRFIKQIIEGDEEMQNLQWNQMAQMCQFLAHAQFDVPLLNL